MEQHYCLKWNNHPKNIASVFDRLRAEELFVDVTLATSDRQTIHAHKVLLSAGSGYLERILLMNPSEHPTVVLSNIRYKELKLLVDFMYSGEISVDQPMLGNLLEAAKMLQIRGLYENRLESEAEQRTPPPPPEPSTSPASELSVVASSFGHDTEKSTSSLSSSNSRKRYRTGESARSSIGNMEEEELETTAPVLPPSKMLKPVHGVSNTGWMMTSERHHRGGDGISEDTEEEEEEEEELKEEGGMKEAKQEVDSPDTDNIPDIPSLLNLSSAQKFFSHFNATKSLSPGGVVGQEVGNSADSPPLISEQVLQAMQLCGHPYLSQLAALQNSSQVKSSATSAAQQPSASTPTAAFTGSFASFPGLTDRPGSTTPDFKNGILSSGPVRRYKQYTEDTLQAALKEIMEGQSINRSSMKYNIPARTLRDWMKRLNIKSVYTHHASKDGKEGSVGSISPEPDISIHVSEKSQSGGYNLSGMADRENGSLNKLFSATDRRSPQALEIDEGEEGGGGERVGNKGMCGVNFKKIAQAAV